MQVYIIRNGKVVSEYPANAIIQSPSKGDTVSLLFDDKKFTVVDVEYVYPDKDCKHNAYINVYINRM
jgi:hypothetical protein